MRLVQRLATAVLAALFALSLTMTVGHSQAQRRDRGIEIVNGRRAAAGEVLIRLVADTTAQADGVGAAVDADDNVRIGGAGWRRVRSRSQTTAQMLARLASR